MRVVNSDLSVDLQNLRELRGGMTEQSRGNEFATWLVKLLNRGNLDATGSYRPRGEEIDGSFVLDGRVFLLEAKWTAKPLPASSIYAFKGKVDGKLVGTIGVYISMAGFHPDTIEALQAGKELNVILVAGDELDVALEQGVAWMLREKLRAAAERGVVYHPVSAREITPASPNTGALDRMIAIAVEAGVRVGPQRPGQTFTARPPRGPRVYVIVEGPEDRAVAHLIAKRIVRGSEWSNSLSLEIVVAGSASLLPLTARGLASTSGPADVFVLLADGNYESEDLRRADIVSELGDLGRPVRVIVANPTVATAWGGTEPPRGDIEETAYGYELEMLDLDDLERLEPSLAEFVDALETAAPGEI